ncbi:MAG: serine hydrolase [Pseudomonadota bacterium]
MKSVSNFARIGAITGMSLGLLLGACVTAPTESADLQAANTSVDAAMSQAVRDYLTPVAAMRDFSGIIRIERNDAVLVEEGYGFADWERGIENTGATRFAAGSITKGMTAAILFVLEENGALNRQDLVSTYLPGFVHGANITLDQVLRHEAGLPRDVPDSERASIGKAGLIQWLNAQSFENATTSEYAYSNVGYEVLALAFEAATAKNYAQLANELIFTPLGMANSTIETQRNDMAPNAAIGHDAGPLPLDVQRADVAPALAIGAEGIVATAADLIRWVKSAVNQRPVNLFDDDGDIIGSVQAREIDGATVYKFQGSTKGYGAAVLARPADDLYVAFASNLQTYPLWSLEWALLDIADGKTPDAAPIRKPSTPLTDAHRKFLGEYVHPGFGPFSITERGNGLYMTLLGPGWSFYLSPTVDDELAFRFFNTRFFWNEQGGLMSEQKLIGQPLQLFELAPYLE